MLTCLDRVTLALLSTKLMRPKEGHERAPKRSSSFTRIAPAADITSRYCREYDYNSVIYLVPWYEF